MQESYYDNSNFHCQCGDPESQSCVLEDSLPGQFPDIGILILGFLDSLLIFCLTVI